MTYMERGLHGDCLFVAVPQGEVNEMSLFTHQSIATVALSPPSPFLFFFWCLRACPGGLCLEGRWNFTYIAWGMCAWVFCCYITVQITEIISFILSADLRDQDEAEI